MKLEPLHDFIFVHLLPDEERTRGGIIIPQVAHVDMIGRGTVISAGRGRQTMDGTVYPLSVKEGDVVLFARGSAVPAGEAPQMVPYDGYPDREVLLMREKVVIAIVRDMERDTGLVDQAGEPMAPSGPALVLS